MLQILEQPNGKLCIYSCQENKMLLEDAQDPEVITFILNKEVNSITKNIIKRTQDMISSARHNKEPLHEYILTYEEAIKRMNCRISPAKANAISRAKTYGCSLNPDTNVADKIISALEKAKETYGKMYCPCSIVKDDSTICCCKEWIEGLKNNSIKYCHCKLYINPNFKLK